MSYTAQGGYTNVAGVIGATAAGQVATQIAKLKALIIDGVTNPSGVKSPEFDRIHPSLAGQLQAEVDALAAAIAAAPTA